MAKIFYLLFGLLASQQFQSYGSGYGDQKCNKYDVSSNRNIFVWWYIFFWYYIGWYVTI